MVCSSSWRDLHFRVRSPPGSGVSEMRMVSPMPCCSRMPSAADEATMPFDAHAGLGEAEMDGVVGAARQILIDRDQILHGRNLGRQDDAVLGHAELFGARGRQQRRLHHRLARHRARIARIGRGRVLVHQLGEQFLVERTPVGADADRLVVLVRDLDDVGELRVALVLEADIAGIDAVLVERLGAGRIFGEQLVTDVMEVADQGRGRCRACAGRRGYAGRRRRPPRGRR